MASWRPLFASDNAWYRRISSGDFHRRQRQSNRLQRSQVEFMRGSVDVESNNGAFGVKIRNQSSHDLARFDTWLGHQLDIEAVPLGIIMKLHLSCSLPSVEEGVVDGFAVGQR